MASERSKCRDLLALSFITKSISKKLLIKKMKILFVIICVYSHQSCYDNETTPLRFLLTLVFLGNEIYLKIVLISLYLLWLPRWISLACTFGFPNEGLRGACPFVFSEIMLAYAFE